LSQGLGLADRFFPAKSPRKGRAPWDQIESAFYVTVILGKLTSAIRDSSVSSTMRAPWELKTVGGSQSSPVEFPPLNLIIVRMSTRKFFEISLLAAPAQLRRIPTSIGERRETSRITFSGVAHLLRDCVVIFGFTVHLHRGDRGAVSLMSGIGADKRSTARNEERQDQRLICAARINIGKGRLRQRSLMM
jgi:hypothetical protein